MLSVNQLNANVKLVEIWKAKNVEDYPLKIEHQSVNSERTSTRADTQDRPKEIGKTLLAQKLVLVMLFMCGIQHLCQLQIALPCLRLKRK